MFNQTPSDRSAILQTVVSRIGTFEIHLNQVTLVNLTELTKSVVNTIKSPRYPIRSASATEMSTAKAYKTICKENYHP